MDNLRNKEYRAHAIFLLFKRYLAKVFFTKAAFDREFCPRLITLYNSTACSSKSPISLSNASFYF